MRSSLVRGVRVAELAAWICWRSFVGGVDVARRALWVPHPDVEPEWVVYETGLTSGAALAAFALVANLMPGSLTAQIEESRIHVHVIDSQMDVSTSLAALERRIASIEMPRL